MAFGWFSKRQEGASKALQRAEKLAAQGRWAEALSYYQDELDRDPDCTAARGGARTCREQLMRWNLEEAQTYARAGEPEKALEHAQLAVEVAGDEADLEQTSRELLGALQADMQAPAAGPAAERLFPPSCSSCPAPACDHDADSSASREQDEEDPRDLFEFYLEGLAPAEQAMLQGLGEEFERGFVLLQQGELEAAHRQLGSAAQALPDVPGPAYALGLLEALQGDPAAAAARFARCLELESEFAAAAYHRVEVLREMGHRAEASAFLEEWIQRHPDDAEALLLAAAGFLEQGNAAEACEAAAAASRLLPPEDLRPRLLEGQGRLLAGERKAALKAFQAVAARKPDLLQALVPLGQLLIQEGGASAERAAEVFKHCCRLDADRAWWYLLRVAEAYAARGWATEAREMLETARANLPQEEAARKEWESVRGHLPA